MIGVQLQEILFPSPLDYVLVVLASGTTQKQLEELQVDLRHLESLADKKNLTGVIVTCAGMPLWSSQPCTHLIATVHCTLCKPCNIRIIPVHALSKP